MKPVYYPTGKFDLMMAAGSVIDAARKFILCFVLMFCSLSYGNDEACLIVSKSLTRDEFKQTLSDRGLK